MDIQETVTGPIQEVPEHEVLADKVKKIENDEELRTVIKDWFEDTRTQGMRIGAKMICIAGMSIMEKHLGTKTKPSLRDYERMSTELMKIFAKPLKQSVTTQNNSGEDNGKESSI